MKKHLGFLAIGSFLLVIFVAISAITFQRSRGLIERGYLSSEGNAAENFAILAASNICLTDEQVQKLKGYSYEELMSSEENNALKKMMTNDSFINKVDYAYLMVHLKNDEVKYTVNEENCKRYDAPIGTKLDIMWLLDVNIGEKTDELEQNATLKDYNRYSYYIEEDALIFGEAPTYILNKSEWGDHICGYAPVYTTSGTYIGVIGIELQIGDYAAYCDNAVLAMEVLLATSLLLLSAFFVFIYFKYRELQYEKIYLDPLTCVYNRSYFNNRFIKVMNRRHAGDKFTLMIIDVDWFKKVNDTFGHEIGDEVLSELGAILVEVFGKNRVVRFGGEEFVSGLWISEQSELTDKLNQLYEAIAEHRFSTREITLTVSLGCSYYAAENVNGWLLSGLLRAADCKLYEAKESGRNRYLIEAYDKAKEYKKASKKSEAPKEEKA